MPLSTAHPALVLPLCKLSKNRVSATALIIGSMSPDVEYFIHLLPNRTYSHVYAHAWWFDLIITLFLCFAFHLVVRNPLIDNLPDFLHQRFARFRSFNWLVHFRQHFLVIIISALIGIYSHLIWDEFTHKGCYFVENYSFFSIYLTSIFGIKIFVHNCLQHLSSIIGSYIVIRVLLNLKKDELAFSPTNWWAFWLKALVWAILFLLLLLLWKGHMPKLNIHYFSHFMLSVVSSFFLGVLFLCILYRISKVGD